MLRQLVQDLLALRRGRRWETVLAYGDDARDDGDDLRDVLVERGGGCGAAYAREYALNGVDYGFCLGFKVRLAESIVSTHGKSEASRQNLT